MRFLYSNATSLVNKWDDFKDLIYSAAMPHIIMITETCFNDKSLVVLDGYNHFIKNVRKDVGAMEELDYLNHFTTLTKLSLKPSQRQK